MPVSEAPWSAERLAMLARAAADRERMIEPAAPELTSTVSRARSALGAERPTALFQQIESGCAPPPAPSESRAAVQPGAPAAADLLKQRASLELALQKEVAARQEVEKAFAAERTDYQQALESLNLQRARVRELEQERAKLVAEIRGLEDRLRIAINQTEEVTLKLQKLQESRKSLGDQATTQTEQLNQVRAENERLREQVEAALRERDAARESAQVKVEKAESHTAEAAFAELWAEMGKAFPDLFIDTHVANRQTFENLGEAFIELVRAMAVLEAHVLHMLRDLRQVGEASDPLSQFFNMFSKNPNLITTLRDFLTSRKRTGTLANLVRAYQAWARAFGSGLHKVVMRADSLLAEELNYKKWPLKTGFGKSEDAAIGEHFRQVAQKAIPDRLGTRLRKEAADHAYQDYNVYMRRTR